MYRHLLLLGFAAAGSLQPQTPPSPQPPFTAKEAELGKQLAATSLDVRKQITNMRAPAESSRSWVISTLSASRTANPTY